MVALASLAATLAISGIMASIYANRHMKQSDREAAGLEYELQSKLNEQEYERKTEFYEKYESPEAQVRQYKEAGLNPMLLAGGGASVSASGGIGSPGSVSASNTTESLTAVLPSLLSTIFENKYRTKELEIQREKTDSEIRVNEALERKYNADTEGKNIENQFSPQEHELSIKSSLLSMAKTKAERVNIEANTKHLQSETRYMDILSTYQPNLMQATEQKYLADVRLSDARIREINSIIEKNQHEMREIDERIHKLAIESAHILTLDALTEREIDESEARARKLNEEIREIGARIGLTEKDIKYYVWNHPRISQVGPIRYNSSSYNGFNQDYDSLDDWTLHNIMAKNGYEIQPDGSWRKRK